MIPVRCFTCGKIIGNKWETFQNRRDHNKEDVLDILKSLKIQRYCCKRMFLGQNEKKIEHLEIYKNVS